MLNMCSLAHRASQICRAIINIIEITVEKEWEMQAAMLTPSNDPESCRDTFVVCRRRTRRLLLRRLLLRYLSIRFKRTC